MGTNDTGIAKSDSEDGTAHPETRLMINGAKRFRQFVRNLSTRPPVSPRCWSSPAQGERLPDAGRVGKSARGSPTASETNFGLGYIWGFNPQATDMVFKALESAARSLWGLSGRSGPRRSQLELVNDRTNIFAGHLNYTVDQLASIPINTAIRGEMALYPSEPYNISQYPGLLVSRQRNPNSRTASLKKIPCAMRGIRPATLIPFLQDDPWRPFRCPFKFFSDHFNHEDGIHPFAARKKYKR